MSWPYAMYVGCGDRNNYRHGMWPQVCIALPATVATGWQRVSLHPLILHFRQPPRPGGNVLVFTHSFCTSTLSCNARSHFRNRRPAQPQKMTLSLAFPWNCIISRTLPKICTTTNYIQTNAQNVVAKYNTLLAGNPESYMQAVRCECGRY